ncbi:hypothetical protein [Kocuria atrinae]|uniref:hypothetical protein n=1 Tax=Kocuria atrinae TaxID=592377 RepID=UPI0003107307|nr:hypothetical protein [Kocuria atrinae]
MNFSGELIGLDIGGSTTRGVLFRDGQAVRHAKGPSANVQNVSADAAAAALRDVFGELGPGLPPQWSPAPVAWTPPPTPLGSRISSVLFPGPHLMFPCPLCMTPA